MATAYEIPYLEPLDGDPGRLEATAGRYTGAAEHIRAIIAQMSALADTGESAGEAVEAFHGKATEVAAALDSVLPRYETTAVAVQEYAIELADAQSRADRAIEAIGQERDTLFGLYQQRDEATQALYTAQAGNDPSATDARHADIQVVQARIAEHEGSLDALLAGYADAAEAKRVAAQTAAGKIVPVLEELNNSFLDHVGSVLDGIGDAVYAIGEWNSSFLEATLHALAELVVTATLVTVTVATMAAIVPNPLTLRSRIARGDSLADGRSANEVLDDIIATSLVVTTVANDFMKLTLLIEANKPTPQMTYQGTATVTTKDEDDVEYTQYQRAFLHAGKVDENGLGAKTQVQIVRAGTEEGKPVWRVVVPSTQDWENYSGIGDAGAANDLGSNLALMLAPNQRAAYERMVLDAMDQAGIQKDDPVMMVGWSQGGILAGKLAADPHSGYNIEAIAVAGAPIDHMDIPDGTGPDGRSVSVVAIQHHPDLVHRLDGQAPPPPSDNWVTVEAPPNLLPGEIAHGSEPYARTAQALDNHALAQGGVVAPETQEKFEDIKKEQKKFFSNNELARVYEGAETY